MNTLDIRNYLWSHAPWVKQEKTVDHVLAGDGQKEIHTVGVGWMATIYNLHAAHERGCDLLVSHEPLYWDHWGTSDRHKVVGPGITKQRFLQETGMVVLRAHDSWDNWPEIGIRDSWAAGLGFTRFVAQDETRWHAVYAIEPMALRDLARYVAKKIAVLGEDSVRVYGDPDRVVSRPSLGVGCGGPDRDMVELGSDALIVCDDGASYWSTRERLAEMGVGVIVVEHGTSEMWGIENLARHLAATFPELDVMYLDQHPRPWTVMG
jgi:putative NIF3 family GTP cyclohydrolase 1 type 2